MNPRNTARGLISVACACALAWSSVPCAAQASDSPTGTSAKRRFTVDDLFRLESLVDNYGGPFAVSPDGRKLAIARLRPKATALDHRLGLHGFDRADIWLQLDPRLPVEKLTDGSTDGSGWWAPQWSPDGEHLAMLSTRGGGATLWVWSAKTRELRQITQRSISLSLTRPYAWRDSRSLLYPAMPPGQQSAWLQLELETPEIATAMWAKVRAGEVTASALQSGVDAEPDAEMAEELWLVDIGGKANESIASGRTLAWQVSPDGGAVAYARLARRGQPREGEALEGLNTWDVDVVEWTPSGRRTHQSIARDVLTHTLRWSRRGTRVGVLEFGRNRRELLLTQVDRNPERRTQTVLAAASPQPADGLRHRLSWADDDTVIVRLAPRLDAPTGRNDWWIARRKATPACLTCSLPSAPDELRPRARYRQSWLAVAGGDLWSISAAGVAGNLTSSFEPSLARFATLPRGQDGMSQAAALLVETSDRESSPHVYSITQSGHLAPVPFPRDAAGAELALSTNGTLLWVKDDEQGLEVHRTDLQGGKETLVFAANQFLRNVQSARFRAINYVGLNGEELKAWLILPPDYREGARYPLLTWVYAGSIAGAAPRDSWRINSNHVFNLQVPAASGYAVLVPSMPLRPEGTPDDPMLKLQNGVLPAVDKAIAMGIADPSRLFVMGHSFGGYSTMGLIAQTSRFRAAAALAGPANLISEYGQLDARRRYSDSAHRYTTRQAMLETGQGRMGGPPWEQFNRYLRNSPSFYVDRVETPLLIAQGDLDYIDLLQGEEFFTALNRRGRRAQFVRYWGEGHVLQSPANIRDLWSRVLDWFEEFSPPTADTAAAP